MDLPGRQLLSMPCLRPVFLSDAFPTTVRGQLTDSTKLIVVLLNTVEYLFKGELDPLLLL